MGIPKLFSHNNILIGKLNLNKFVSILADLEEKNIGLNSCQAERKKVVSFKTVFVNTWFHLDMVGENKCLSNDLKWFTHKVLLQRPNLL